jgi:hypothetical protein
MLRVAHFPCANGPMSYVRKTRPVGLSIGILTCNKESPPEPMLSSLFRQSVFERLAARHERCEISLRAHRFPRVRPAARMEVRKSGVVLSKTRGGTP